MRTMTTSMRPHGIYMYAKELGTVWLMGSNEDVVLDMMIGIYPDP